MAWLAFAIVVLGIIYFAISSDLFRRGLLFMVLGIAALAAVGGIIAYVNAQQEEQRRQVARKLIRPDQLEITDATLSIGMPSEMNAVVTNKSPYHLAELALMVTVVDCPADSFSKFYAPPPGYERVKKDDPSPGKPCTAVGEYVAREYGLNIPSGQRRAFRGYVHFNNLPPLKPNEWSWHYSIVEIVGVPRQGVR